MRDIHTFLRQATDELGIGQTQASEAVIGLLRFLRRQLPTTDSNQLIDALPGADLMLDPIPSETVERDPIDTVLNDAGEAMGYGVIAGRLGVMEVLKSADLDSSTAATLVEMLFETVRHNVGRELVTRVVGRIPELKLMVAAPVSDASSAT